MRFKVAKSDLEDALQVVGASLSSNGSDISGHYTFRRTGPDEDGKYGVEVLTNSERVFSSCPIIVSVEDEGTVGGFTVEGWRLKEWVKFVPADSVPEFILDDGEVVVRVKKGKQTFQSLDYTKFPYWDKALKDAKLTARIPADRLAAALGYSRLFASDNDTGQPDMCVCEVKEGTLFSSDKKAVTLIEVLGMDQSEMRVHAKDVSGFLSFLGHIKEGEVEILEHERMLFVRRCSGGAVFGESRFFFSFPFPKMKIADLDQHQWSLPKAELQQVVGFLVSGAVKEDNRLRMAPGETAGTVSLSMTSATGKVTVLPLVASGMESDPKAPEVPDEGFLLDHRILTKIVGAWKGDDIRFGVNVKGDGGFVRFSYSQLESKYLTILPWIR